MASKKNFKHVYTPESQAEITLNQVGKKKQDETEVKEAAKPGKKSAKTAPKKKAAGTREAPPCVRPSTPEEEEAADLAAGRKRLSFLVGQSSALLWVGTTLLYFLWSFVFGGWQYTWLIFLWATLGQILLSEAESYNEHRNMKKTLHDTVSGCLWVGAALAFFVGGFFLHAWRLSWLVFLAATLLQILVETFLPEK